MDRQTGILLVCVLVCFFLVQLVMDKDTSALITNSILGLALGSFLAIVIKKRLPIELLPDLDRKAVFITGCDTGFGNGLAGRMDALGMTVYAGCLFPDGPGAKALKEKASNRLHIVKLDVTDDTDVINASEYVKKTLGDKVLWAIVNNAGIATCSELEWHSFAAFNKVIDVNLLGQFRVVKVFLPLLRRSKGRIVNVASVAGHCIAPWMVPYCISKHGSVVLSDGLREELRKFSISVHTIEPYFYMTTILNCLDQTNLWDECPEHIKEAYGHNYIDFVKKRANFLVLKLANPAQEVSPVINCMVNACAGVNPPDVNSPSIICALVRFLFIYFPGPTKFLLSVLMYQKSLPGWEELFKTFSTNEKKA